MSTCEEVLGLKIPKQKDWISAESLHKIQMRKGKKVAVNNSRTRAAKAMAQEEFSKANKEVKKSIKSDKHSFTDGLAEEAEEAAASGNMRKLYDTTRKLSGKHSKPERPVKVKMERQS